MRSVGLLMVLVAMLSVACSQAPTTPAATSAAAGQSTGSGSSGSYGYGASAPATAAPASSSGGSDASGAVAIKGFAFAPASITAKIGQAVTWNHQDDVGHTVTADDKSFDSGTLTNGKSFSHTFDHAGTFTYHCSIHASMKGTVIVQ